MQHVILPSSESKSPKLSASQRMQCYQTRRNRQVPLQPFNQKMTDALSCVMLAAIPTLIAMKRAPESLGKLADATREELPGTMAAVRLFGMEISDLTMELSDLGYCRFDVD